jgi:hypothetical protein
VVLIEAQEDPFEVHKKQGMVNLHQAAQFEVGQAQMGATGRLATRQAWHFSSLVVTEVLRPAVPAEVDRHG